jgi:carotenoid 1,2-hydratase
MTEDGRHGLTVIAFIGSVFSPYYARRRMRGPADPLNHCAINIALYGGRGKRWAMTERGGAAVHCAASSLTVGPSAVWWDGSVLTMRVNEVSVPIPSRLRGVVRAYPTAITGFIQRLDAGGHHRWWPIAPLARIEVAFDEPRVQWDGRGYIDANFGDQPLESDFVRWDWSRACLTDQTVVLYDVVRRDGTDLCLALQFDAAGNVARFPSPPAAQLPPTRWRVHRKTRADRGGAVSVIETLEDAPFYARSNIETHLLGERTTAMHESLSLDRFRKRWVQALLPFRMPRAWSRQDGGQNPRKRDDVGRHGAPT